MKKYEEGGESADVAQPDFLPMSRAEMDRLGWGELDILLVTGDAYVDHPAFGAALLGRWLVAHGFRVGIVAQPRWIAIDDIVGMGRPRLFAGVTAGALDSMLAHYTAFRKKRSDDAFTPGGRSGARPNRASIVYTGLVRQAFPGLPVALGGIEASLRRATHYDFWSDAIRRSLLLDSKADLLIYGMAERAVVTVAQRLERGLDLTGIAGTIYAVSKDGKYGNDGSDGKDEEGGKGFPSHYIVLPSHEEILSDPKMLMTATLALERHVHEGRSWAVQTAGNRNVVFAPPARPLTTAELDEVYALPFARRAHPAYTDPIPAVEMVLFSVTSHRGCAGGCSFCALALHQGRRIRSRSANSIRAEVAGLTEHPEWKGSLTDVGGPTANMWRAQCTADPAACLRESCLYPAVCPHFKARQQQLVALLDSLAEIPGVKHVRVASGVRHDLALLEPAYAHALVRRFTGGQLKIAPEHICISVLDLMRKASPESFLDFIALFEKESRNAGKKQFIIPYLLSAFPGCTDDHMRELAGWLRKRNWKPQQVQCFIPTPGTVATAMYYAAIDSAGNPIHVARTDAQRLRQHRILVGETSAGPVRSVRSVRSVRRSR